MSFRQPTTPCHQNDTMTANKLLRVRIPALDQIDSMNSSAKHSDRFQVKLKGEQYKALEIDGGFPTQIASITNQNRLDGVDIRVGDYIIAINGQNVSRAVAKTVGKILKCKNSGSQEVTLTIYRKPNNQMIHHGKQEMKKLGSNNIFKTILSLFSAPKSCVMSQDETVIQRRRRGDEETVTIDYGYYSIPSSVRSSTTSVSNSSSSSSSAAMSEDHEQSKAGGSLEHDCELFRARALEAIETYVRPSKCVLSARQFEKLFINFEKLDPISRHLLALVRLGDLSNNLDNLVVILEAFKTYLCGLPKSLALLEVLSAGDESFIKFIEGLNETYSFKIMDYLFMPFKFAQVMLHHLYPLVEQNPNGSRLKKALDELYDMAAKVYMDIEETCEDNNSTWASATYVSSLSSCSS